MKKITALFLAMFLKGFALASGTYFYVTSSSGVANVPFNFTAASTFTTILATNINDSALTSGRVPFMTTSGRFTDASGFTFNGTTVSAAGVSGTNVQGSTVSATTAFVFPDGTRQTTAASSTLAVGSSVSGGGANRVLYEDGSQLLAASASQTYDGTTFTVGQSSITKMIIGGNGTTASSAIQWAGDANTGLIHPSSERIDFVANGTAVESIEEGLITIRSGSVMQGPNGTAAAPIYGFTSGTSSGGLYVAGAGLGVSQGGANAATFMASTTTFPGLITAVTGVGIGTTTPTAQLTATGSVRFSSFGAGAATFDANGNISSVSDERLKIINEKYTRGLSSITSINPVVYHYKKSSGLDTVNAYAGFTTQDVKKSIPEAVFSAPGKPDSLWERAITAALVNAVKELDSKVAVLEKQIKKMEQKGDSPK